MDITTFSESLHKQLKETDLLTNSHDDLVKTGKALSFIREKMIELKHFTVRYTFKDDQEEVQFFKEVKPILLSQYFYYKKLFAVLLFDSFRDRKSRVKNYYRVLEKFQNFARKNQAFYEYCMSGATYLDTSYFKRSSHNRPGLDRDEKFSTGFDTRLSKILAHELMKQYIMEALHRLREGKESANALLTWTDSKVALIELIYSLHASGVISNGRGDIKQVVQGFEELFAIDLGNYARVFSEIRGRKSGPSNFLEHLREKLCQYVEELK